MALPNPLPTITATFTIQEIDTLRAAARVLAKRRGKEALLAERKGELEYAKHNLAVQGIARGLVTKMNGLIKDAVGPTTFEELEANNYAGIRLRPTTIHLT